MRKFFSGIFLFLLSFAPVSPAAEIFLTTGSQTHVEWMTSNDVSTTTVTFDFGGLEVKALRATNWVENPMLLRPQLLLWRCGPLSSPSTVHLELLANDHHAEEKGKVESLINPAVVAQGYTPDHWLVLTNAQPIEAMPSSSFQKLDVEPDKKGFREEIHIFETNGLGFRMHITLSPRLDSNNESAIRSALNKLIIIYPPQKR